MLPMEHLEQHQQWGAFFLGSLARGYGGCPADIVGEGGSLGMSALLIRSAECIHYMHMCRWVGTLLDSLMLQF